MWQQRRELIAKIEKLRKSRVLCYVTSDRPNTLVQIARDAVPLFSNQLQQFEKPQRLDVFIFTAGGDTLAAFALARVVREFANYIGVLIPEKCHSAGTLFALGANEIFMTRSATLSPIDPSVITPLNPRVPSAPGALPGQIPAVPVSVESVAGFKALLTEDWEIKEEQYLSDAFRILAEKVEPLVLGDVFRRRQQIELLARRLLEQHREDRERVEKIITVLTRELGSHDYPISRSEAKELIGQQIAPDDEALESQVWELYQDYAKDLLLGVPYYPEILFHQVRSQADKDGRVKVSQNLAVIESTSSRYVFEQKALLSEAQIPGPIKSAKAVQIEVIALGWEHSKA